MDLLSLMEKEAIKTQVNEEKHGRTLILKGYEQDGKTTFSYDKGSSGFVYGYAIRLNEREKQLLLDEAIKLKGNSVKLIKDMQEIGDGFYPLYWGKSELIFGRLNAHLKGHKRNSNLHLSDYQFFQNKEIIYSVLMVTDNIKFENHLNGKYPPLLKTFVN
jgi:hypothetical protein